MNNGSQTNRDSGGEPEKPLPLEDVSRLVELVREGGIGEISVRRGELEITVKARTAAPAAPQTTAQVAEMLPNTAESEGSGNPKLPEPDSRAKREGLHEVKSPVVGTFYRAPAPGEDTYVEVGDKVRAGQTLCIVEAMKLMNEIPSDVSGEVVEVLAENSDGVQYDEPLFYLRPEA